MDYLIVVFVVGAIGYLVYALIQVFSPGQSAGSQAVRQRLAALEAGDAADEASAVDIVKKTEMSSLPMLDAFLSRARWSADLNRLIAQAGMSTPLGVIVLASLVCAVFGFLTVYAATGKFLVSLAAGGGALLIPLWRVKGRKKARVARFEEQLPEALDLVGRALRAGHTFGSGMGMVAQEFEDPIKSEFAKTLEEINFGLNASEALDNLSGRVDCEDLRFFVVSVKIQSETGGNLAEIVGNIAGLIRERFKLKGRVRVLSAEGRFAAWVLCLMPPVIAVVINLLNPGYLGVLFEEDLGKSLLYMAAGMMVTGVIVIKRMVDIKV